MGHLFYFNSFEKVSWEDIVNILCARKESSMKKERAGKIAAVAMLLTLAIGVGVGGFAIKQGWVGKNNNAPAICKKIPVTQVSTNKQKAKDCITIHYKWKEGQQPHIYYNVEKTGQKTSYPGVPMKEEGDGWYSYTVKNAKNADCIISVPEMDYQTTEFERKSGEYWYDEECGWSTEAPENYKVNAEQEEKVESDAVTVAEESKVTLHFTSNWDSVSIYYWNALPVDQETDWPGQKLEKDSNGYYSCTFSSVNKINFLYTNGEQQTKDFSVKEAGEYWFEDGKWTKNPSQTTAPEETKTPEQTTEPEETEEPKETSDPNAGEIATYADTRTDFRDESIYFLMTTRFYDGDPSNNARTSHDDEVQNPSGDPSWRGDFKGLAEKLDYIKALGFTSVWITPVVKNRSQYDYHGYHAYNFKQVDSRYESGDFSYQDLIDACHKKGLKIIQDIVLNHTGGSGEENLQTLSTNESGTIDGQDPNNVFHHFDYIKSWESYQCQVTHIDSNCIDLNTENPNVIQYLKDAYNHYIDMGVDGFRIDTMKHISRLTFNKEFAPAFLAEAKKNGNDNFYMFGEVCARDENAIYFSHYACISAFFYTWGETKDYAWGDMGTNMSSAEQHWKDYEDMGDEKARKEFNSENALLKGNEYHKPDYSNSSGMGVIDFPMHWAFRNAKKAFNRGVQDDKLYNDATWNVVYVDSHDYAPNTMEKMRYSGTTEDWAENLSLMFTFRGIPCLYYGSEVEFKKGKPIDDYEKKLEDTGRAYYGDYLEGDVTATDFGVYTASGKVATTLSEEYPLVGHLQRLNKIRQAIPALRKGQYSVEDVDGSMAYKRRYTDDKVDSFVCVTVTDGATFKNLPGGTYTDAVTGDTKTIKAGGTLEIAAPGKGNMRAYVLNTAKTKAPGKVGKDGKYLK